MVEHNAELDPNSPENREPTPAELEHPEQIGLGFKGTGEATPDTEDKKGLASHLKGVLNDIFEGVR